MPQDPCVIFCDGKVDGGEQGAVAWGHGLDADAIANDQLMEVQRAEQAAREAGQKQGQQSPADVPNLRRGADGGGGTLYEANGDSAVVLSAWKMLDSSHLMESLD